MKNTISLGLFLVSVVSSALAFAGPVFNASRVTTELP